MIYLTVEELLRIAERAVGGTVHVRDHGLLASAAARPQTTVFGQDAYPDLMTKAAALMHSLVHNHALLDGNKRLSWLATVTFCALNGADIHTPVDDGLDLTVGVATDRYDLEQIAATLAKFRKPAPTPEEEEAKLRAVLTWQQGTSGTTAEND